MDSLRILLLGDASNYHNTLAIGLRNLGHQVTIASNGTHWMNTGRDIDLSRSAGKIGGAILWLKLNTVLAGRLKGYDVVQVHNPVFLDLMPHRVRSVFDRVKRDNGAVYLTALGHDTPYVDMCLADDCPLRYSEWRVGDKPTPYYLAHRDTARAWTTEPLASHCRHIYENIDGVVSALYEYHLACQRVLPPEKLAYGGIPVVCDPAASVTPHDGSLRVMVACHKGREDEKGVDLMLPVLRSVAAAHLARMRLDVVQNVPFAVFDRMLRETDVVVDQLYSYTPATTALMSMAKGKIVVSGAEEEYYRMIGEDRLRPIINADPLNPGALQADMEALIQNTADARRRQLESIEFVRKHNSPEVVAQRFINFWTR